MGATGLYFDPTSPFYFTTPVIVWICSFGQGSRQNLHNAWEHVQPGHDRGREEGGAENLDPTVLRLHCWICWRHILVDRLCLPILALKMGGHPVALLQHGALGVLLRPLPLPQVSVRPGVHGLRYDLGGRV